MLLLWRGISALSRQRGGMFGPVSDCPPPTFFFLQPLRYASQASNPKTTRVIPSDCLRLADVRFCLFAPPPPNTPGVETQEKAEASEEETLGRVPRTRELTPEK